MACATIDTLQHLLRLNVTSTRVLAEEIWDLPEMGERRAAIYDLNVTPPRLCAGQLFHPAFEFCYVLFENKNI